MTGCSSRLSRAEKQLVADIDGCRTFDIGNMHCIELQLGGEVEGKMPLCMLPGYGMGGGGFFLLLEAFAALAKNGTDVPFSSIYALDWPGSGLSGKALGSSGIYSLLDLELDSLIGLSISAIEEWRKAMDIGTGSNKPFALLGHSLGAYLAFHYAEWYSNGKDGTNDNLCHLLLVSPFGLGCYPAWRSGDQQMDENAWLVKWSLDLHKGRRPRNDYDVSEDGEESRGLTTWNRGFKMLACCAPCLLLSQCINRFRSCALLSSDPIIYAPISQIIAQAGLPWLRRIGIRVFLSMRFKDNGQWKSSIRPFPWCCTFRCFSGTLKKSRFAWYLNEYTSREAGRGFGEVLFHKAVLPFSFGQFWPRVHIGGDCTEWPFENGAECQILENPRLLGEAIPYSDGRLQQYIRMRRGKETRRREEEEKKGAGAQNMVLSSRFRVSFIYGAMDDMDCRLAVDISREFSGTVNAVREVGIVRIDNASHQLMIDNPVGLAHRIIELSSYRNRTRVDALTLTAIGFNQ